MSIISLREHIERAGAQPAFVSPTPHLRDAEARPVASRGASQQAGSAALAGFRDVVMAMGEAGERAVPPVSQEFHQSLMALAARLAPDASAETIASVGQGVASEIGQWSEGAAQYLKEKADLVREIVVLVARTAEAVGERDSRFAGEFEELTGRLRQIARIENVANVRRSLVESASQLNACVTKMTEEGQRSMEQMRAQVDSYRCRLEEAERRASIDPLTGLSNRGASENVLAERIRLARPFCVILLDLNNFKGVNDSLGHTAGDDLLKQFSTELRAQFAPSDTVGRWGGDEFIGILEGHLDQARTYQDRIERWGCGDYSITAGGQTHKIPLRASLGMAEWDGTESPRDLIARADRELYDAKGGLAR